MISKTQKRATVISVALLVSAFIWHVNASWGNVFTTCLILSTTTFLIIFTPFEIYFSFRDLWFERWDDIELEGCKTSKLEIEVDRGTICGDLIRNEDSHLERTKNALIIVCHGFSDTKEDLQYFYLPLALQGYAVLAYDARGTGESKNVGKRSEFIKRIKDYELIVDFVKGHDDLGRMSIFSVGFSIGATTVLCGGFARRDVQKIVAISAMAHFQQNIPKWNPIILLSYLLKGVSLNPTSEENEQLSPHVSMRKVKESVSKEEWRRLSRRVFLVHARNDKVIGFENFEQNRDLLELPPQNQLIFRKGGHSLKKNELSLVGAVIEFFDRST